MAASTPQDLFLFVRSAPVTLLYFTGPDCGVCHSLWPRIEAMLAEEFPHIPWRKVDAQEERAFAAQSGVFAIPTVLCYFDGKEGLRLVRSFGLQQLRDALERPYRLLFS